MTHDDDWINGWHDGFAAALLLVDQANSDPVYVSLAVTETLRAENEAMRARPVDTSMAFAPASDADIAKIMADVKARAASVPLVGILSTNDVDVVEDRLIEITDLGRAWVAA